MITLHCPKTLNSKLFVLLGCVSLRSPSLYYMIMEAENIDINSKKNEKRLVNKKFQEIRKGIIIGIV